MSLSEMPGLDGHEGLPTDERRRGRAGIVMLVIAVLMGAVLIAGGWVFYERAHRPSALPPPDGPWPRTGRLTVFLCRTYSPFPTCENKAYTNAQLAAIKAVLRSHPEVQAPVFRSQNAEYLATIKRTPGLAGMIHVADLNATLNAALQPGDWSALVTELQKLPGVSVVYAWKDFFWVGKADAAVGFCRAESTAEKSLGADVPRVHGPCDGHARYPSPEERQTILERILTLPGIAKVYYADQDQMSRVLEYMTGDATSPDLAQGAFMVKFAGRPDAATVDKQIDSMKEALTTLPGVAAVTPVSDFY
ncbi:hypothetical protein J5X84_38540 [Streptosporangiaceae bacterium NEAU-GS5]|nr:hypothetical protein [Streptosporangiaceae bacterium NEAU-GS5]